MEVWKEVEAKGMKWLVCADGRVKTPAHTCEYTRKNRDGKVATLTNHFEESIASPCKTRNGYLEVYVRKNGKRTHCLVHRLVGIAFVPGYREGLTINHINGDKLDNRVENLEWVSLARNTQHQWEEGLVDLRGEKSPNSKLTSKQVIYIRRLLSQGISMHTLAVIAGVDPNTIAYIRDGKRWASVTLGNPVQMAN